MDRLSPIATVDQLRVPAPAPAPAQPAQLRVAQGVRVQAPKNKNGKKCPNCKQLSPNAVKKCKQPVKGGTCGYVWNDSKSTGRKESKSTGRKKSLTSEQMRKRVQKHLIPYDSPWYNDSDDEFFRGPRGGASGASDESGF